MLLKKINVFYPTRPHESQKKVLAALDKGDRYVVLRAGRKFRKTSLGISWLIEKALETGLTCPYIAPNRVQAKNIVWNDHIPRIITHFKQQGLDYDINKSELSITFPNGGKVQLLGVENKEALRGISNWSAVFCDEYDDWTEDIWPTIIRPNLIPHKAPALIAGTPKGYKNLYRLEKNPAFTSFHFRSHDNPDLDPSDLQELENEYKELGEAYYRQEILAEYERPVGTVYGSWDMERQYVPFEYDHNLPLHLSWDFGINDPTAIIFIQPNGSELRIIDYYEASNANIEHFVQYVNSLPYKVPALETGDIAGNARELTSGKSPISELARLGHHVRTSQIPNIPVQIRNAHKYMSRIYISSSNERCWRLVECMTNYRYPEKSTALVNQSNEVPIHDEFSHGMRALEYYLWNITERSDSIAKEPPADSIFGHLKKKREERLLRQEYVGY